MAAALALTALVSSCSDDSDDAAPATTGVSYTVDGSNVTATTAAGTSLGSEIAITGVSGAGTANKGVLLTIPKRTGTFTLSDTATVATASYLASGNSTDIYDATSGSIVVTTYTPSTTTGASNVVGTYSFTGTNSAGATKAVTNGKFNVKY